MPDFQNLAVTLLKSNGCNSSSNYLVSVASGQGSMYRPNIFLEGSNERLFPFDLAASINWDQHCYTDSNCCFLIRDEATFWGSRLGLGGCDRHRK